MSKIEPIVSPWIFYLIEVISTLKVTSLVVAITTAGIAMLFLGMGFFMADKEYESVFAKHFKRSLIICIIASTVSILCPSQNTMYKMLISNYVTPNNLEYIHETIKGDMNDALNAIADNIIKVQKEGK